MVARSCGDDRFHGEKVERGGHGSFWELHSIAKRRWFPCPPRESALLDFFAQAYVGRDLVSGCLAARRRLSHWLHTLRVLVVFKFFAGWPPKRVSLGTLHGGIRLKHLDRRD